MMSTKPVITKTKSQQESYVTLLQLHLDIFTRQLEGWYNHCDRFRRVIGVHPISGAPYVGPTTSTNQLAYLPPPTALERSLSRRASQLVLPPSDIMNQLRRASTEPARVLILLALIKTMHSKSTGTEAEIAVTKGGGWELIANDWLKNAISIGQFSLATFCIQCLSRRTFPEDAGRREHATQHQWMTEWSVEFKTLRDKSVLGAVKSWLRKDAAAAAAQRKKKSSAAVVKKHPSPPATPVESKADVLGDLLSAPQAKKNKSGPVSTLQPTRVNTANKTTTEQVLTKPTTGTSTTNTPSAVLPQISRFETVTEKPKTRKIRWADEESKELEEIFLIERRSDIIADQDDFANAQRREHLNERNRVANQHLERIVPTTMFKSPPALCITNSELAQAIHQRKTLPNSSTEVQIEKERTANLMETIVLATEEPPDNPIEWVNKAPGSNKVVQIPLTNDSVLDDVTENMLATWELKKLMLPDCLKSLGDGVLNRLLEEPEAFRQVVSTAKSNGSIEHDKVEYIYAQVLKQQEAKRYGSYKRKSSSSRSAGYNGGKQRKYPRNSRHH